MAKRKRPRTGIVFLIVFSVAAIAAVLITLGSHGVVDGVPTWDNVLGQDDKTVVATVGKGVNCVCFVDCGQGDCEVLVSGEHITVVDSGPFDKARQTVQQLKDFGVTKIENFIITHPHEDHIGGAANILETFDVDNIYMVKPSEKNTPKTKTYLSMLEAINSKGLKITQPKIGSTVSMGDFTLKFLSPSKEYDDHNNNSIVFRAEAGGKSFLFTGDAETKPENQMLKTYSKDLNCDVLKVGHHGSHTSTGDKFLKAVSPNIAVIEVGEGNDYGHPKGSTLKKLKSSTVYRTDLNGTIIITVENGNLRVDTQKENS